MKICGTYNILNNILSNLHIAITSYTSSINLDLTNQLLPFKNACLNSKCNILTVYFNVILLLYYYLSVIVIFTSFYSWFKYQSVQSYSNQC